jgi:hypothetical protein
MTTPIEQIVPPAQHQVEPPAVAALHSANAGVVVHKAGQVRSEFRSEGRLFAREVAKHVNNRQGGRATAFVYEETFGVEDRLHFLIHLRSLETYYSLVEMGDQDRAYRESIAKERVDDGGGGAWDRLFVDGSLCSTVLLPQAGFNPPELTLHSGNAGIVLMRSARIGYGFRPEAREIARELVERINKELPGEVTALVYDEAFGETDRVHWLLHLRDLTCYQRLVDRDLLADEGRPGTFVDGSTWDTALTPHHWGLYATRSGA